jgi:hypothetical protein
MRRAYRRGTSRVEKRRKILADLVRIRTAVLDMAYRLTLRSSLRLYGNLHCLGRDRQRADAGAKGVFAIGKSRPLWVAAIILS